ncbi:13024_t:CDS:2, partial [Acaulospora morrowiae]
MHEEVPNIVRLALHLPGMHSVVFDPNDDAAHVLARANRQKTTLIAFFETCATIDVARQYTYQEFPQHFVWNKKDKRWTIRKRGFAIGRLYFANPSAREIFYLRLLLTVVRGPQSFNHLKTVNNIAHPTFKDACLALGLLEDDEEWIQYLEEAAVMCSGFQLRLLFAVILIHCTPTQPQDLWLRFRVNLCDDLLYRLSNEHAIREPTESQIFDFGLFLLDNILHDFNQHLGMFSSMPLWEHNWDNYQRNRFISEHLNWDQNELRNTVDNLISQMNNEQRAAYQDIFNSVTEQYDASLQRSQLWMHVKVHTLKKNMRLEGESEENKRYAQWLLDVGNDVNESKVAIPENMRVSPDLKSLIDAVYYNISVEGICTNQYLKDRIILSSRNDDVDAINRTILNIFPGNKRTYLSSDNVVIEEGADNIGNIYPVEYLNSLNPAGMPPSKLDLKIGCPIILLRNLSPYQGLCNGSRLVVTRLTDHVVEACILC